jgi:signal transduction histidine kinase
LLLSTVLVLVERRVTERVRQRDAAAGAISNDEFLAHVRRDIIINGLAGLLLGVGVSYVLARRVIRPIDELREVAGAIASGNLKRRASMDSEQELRDLSHSLRVLAEQLEDRRRALAAEHELLATLTESLNEGVVVVDGKSDVISVNQTARQQLRLREPVPFRADYLPRDRVLRDALSQVLAGNEATPGEVQVDDRSFSLTARPRPEGGAVLALYDLTPFRRLEAVRRDFVANVSHELRTPLTIVSGFVETLEDEALPPDLRRQFSGMISGNVRRMQRIVDDLLDLSRIESGGWLPNPVEQDFAAIASEVAAPLLPAAQAKGVALRVAAAPNVSLYADTTAARQILSNLAENALRHTQSGEVVLFMERDEGGTWIGVRDTGEGMNAEHLPRIFERFYRADPSRSREAGGTGLGLSIVRHLTEAHGGRVKGREPAGCGHDDRCFFPAR